MKKLLVLLALSALMASAAFAQADPDPDGISVYFDLAGEQTCFDSIAPFELVNANLLITNPSRGGVSGWECNVTATGFTAPGWTLVAGADLGGAAAGAFQEFFVGIGPGDLALMGAETVLVATFEGYVMDPAGVCEFFVGPYTTPSVPGAPAYTDPIDVGIIVPLQVASGNYDLAVAQVNTCTVVETEAQSWGGVKALF